MISLQFCRHYQKHNRKNSSPAIGEEGQKLKETLGSSTLRQMDVAYVQKQYESCGIDTDKLQTNYIWKTGAQMAGFALIIAATTVLISLLASRIGALLLEMYAKISIQKLCDFPTRSFKIFSTASHHALHQ